MAKQVDVERELDRLYGDPPEQFVAGRDELAKRLRADGRKDDAAAVKALKKPTRPAALVNWLSREREKDVAAFARIAERMRDPKLSDGAKLRAAVRDEREAIDGLLDAAGAELETRGGPAATLDRVGETLRAMASDPDVERQVLERRLEREQEASTIGFAPEGGVIVPAKRAEPKEKPAPKKKTEGPDLGKLRRELKETEKAASTAEEVVDRAAARVDEAEGELQAARAALKDAKAEARVARSDAKKAGRRLESAEKQA